MILISHRGNLVIKKPDRENTPAYIQEAINAGFEVEIDVWWHRGAFYLGHDEPLHYVNHDFLKDHMLWCHAKHIEVLPKLLEIGAHCFFHNVDNATLTSRNYIWTYPGQILTDRSICVLPESIAADYDWKKGAGVCSDIIAVLKEMK